LTCNNGGHFGRGSFDRTARADDVHYAFKLTGWAKNRGRRLMTIILSNLNRLKKFARRFLSKFSVEWI